jgi:hypothetical protein
VKVVKNAAGISINQWFVQVDVLARLGIVGIVNHLCLHSLCIYTEIDGHAIGAGTANPSGAPEFTPGF